MESILFACPSSNTTHSWLLQLQIVLKSEFTIPLPSFIFNTVLAILVPLPFHISFRISFSISTKKPAWILPTFCIPSKYFISLPAMGMNFKIDLRMKGLWSQGDGGIGGGRDGKNTQETDGTQIRLKHFCIWELCGGYVGQCIICQRMGVSWVLRNQAHAIFAVLTPKQVYLGAGDMSRVSSWDVLSLVNELHWPKMTEIGKSGVALKEPEPHSCIKPSRSKWMGGGENVLLRSGSWVGGLSDQLSFDGWSCTIPQTLHPAPVLGPNCAKGIWWHLGQPCWPSF